MIDLDEVRCALTAQSVLAHYGFDAKRGGGRDELESSSCPRRADHSRRSFTINTRTGRWQCFPCGYGGDLFTLVAELERLDAKRDFPAVIARAAQIAGVCESSVHDADRAARIAEWKRQRGEAEQRGVADRARRDAEAVPKATSYWGDLEAHDQRGEEYLAERGLGEAMRFGIIRFDPEMKGSPALRLFASDGSTRNVVRRRLPELGEPKTPGLYGCPTAGTLVNSVNEIIPNRDVILTEGVVDSLTAAVMWRRCYVLGAHGAGNLSKIARVAAPKIMASKGRMFIIPHQDKAGFENAKQAISEAHKAGLSMSDGTLGIVKHGAKDLNEAWCGGWRPAA